MVYQRCNFSLLSARFCLYRTLDSSDKLEYPYYYHSYEVMKLLVGLGGLMALWFGQSGLDSQF